HSDARDGPLHGNGEVVEAIPDTVTFPSVIIMESIHSLCPPRTRRFISTTGLEAVHALYDPAHLAHTHSAQVNTCITSSRLANSADLTSTTMSCRLRFSHQESTHESCVESG